MADPQPNLRALFEAALDCPNTDALAAFVERVRRDSPELGVRLAELLQAHRDAGSFLQPSAPGATSAELPGNPPVPTTPDTSAGRTTLIGRYKLLQKLGEGGMGTVYLAEQREPVKRQVALKVIKADSDSAQVAARFEAERQALALMDHPNIARVYDGGTTDTGRPYFVMELVKGIPLTKYCDQEHLTPRERLELFIPVCQAVQHAHQKGIIHRDLKPSNVLIGLYDGQPIPKVIDFGVAKATERRLTDKTLFTEVGQIVGTLEYMAPEQAELNNLDIDTRADVYALGVMLYELLTGSVPFTAQQLRSAAFTEMLRMIREVEPPRPSTLLSSSAELATIATKRKLEPRQLTALVRGELDWIAMKALEKDRSRRYETASSFALDVQRYLADEPVQACPPSAGYRLRKFARKHRGALVTGTTFVVLLLAATALSTGLALWATAAETEAQSKRGEAEEAGRVARTERDAATAERIKARRSADRLVVAEGIRRANEGDLFGALPLLVRPLELGDLTPEEEKIHRTRIACFLRHTPGRPTLRHMLFHDGPVDYTAWSPDARRLLAVREGVVHIWDMRTGKSLATLRHPESVEKAQFTPDGTGVVTVVGRSIWFWEVATSQPVGAPFVPVEAIPELALLGVPQSPLQAFAVLAVQSLMDQRPFEVALSPQSDRILVRWGHSNGVYEAASRRKVAQWRWELMMSQDWGGVSCGFSPDGGRVFLCGGEEDVGLACVFGTDSGTAFGPTITLPGETVSVRLCQNGESIWALGYKDGFSFWDVKTGAPVGKSVHPIAQFNARVSPDCRFVTFSTTSAGPGAELAAILDRVSGQFLPERLTHKGYISQTAFRGDGRQILTAGGDAVVKRWWAKTGLSAGPMLVQRNQVVTASFSPDARQYLTTDQDGVVAVWDLGPRMEQASAPMPERNDSSIWFNRYRTEPIVPGTVPAKVLGGDTRKVGFLAWLRVLPPQLRDARFTAAISPDCLRLVTLERPEPASDVEKAARLWDATTGHAIGQPLCHQTPIVHVEFSPDSRLVVTTSEDGFAQLWDARTTRPIGPMLRPVRAGPDTSRGPFFDLGTGPFHSPLRATINRTIHATFSNDSTLLVASSHDGTAQVWRTANGQPVGKPLLHPRTVIWSGFSPDGRKIVTGSEDCTARVWDAGSGEPLSPPLLHRGSVQKVAFSPLGNLLATVGEQDQIRLWDTSAFLAVIPTQKRVLSPLFQPTAAPLFSSDGRTLIDHATERFFDSTPDRLFDVTADGRPSVDLVLLAQLYSGHRLDAHGGLDPLSVNEVRALWTNLRAKYPEEFTVSSDAALEWRVNELRGPGATTFSRAFHHRWLARELAEAGWVPGPPPDEKGVGDWLSRLYALAQHGRHAEACAAASALAARSAKDAGQLYNCACVHGLAAAAVSGDALLAEQYAARAVALLQQAVASGYTDAKHLLQDPDLAALRGRADFKKLLAEFEKREKEKSEKK